MAKAPVKKSLRIWVCTDHEVHYPAGGASYVVAEDEEQARALLLEALRASGLTDGPFSLEPVPMKPHARVLRDGNY